MFLRIEEIEGNTEAIMRCDACGKEKLDRDMKTIGICKECADKEYTEENAINFGQENNKQVSEYINRFLAYVFNGRINEVLAKEWSGMSDYVKRLYVRSFCDDNWDFDEYVLEKLTKESEEV